MTKYIVLLFPALSFAGPSSPAPFPVFLRPGFSSILEFEALPVRVVLGDSQSFQVERLEKSIVIKTLASSASTNLFVYFRDLSPRLFVLTASEDAEPTYFRRFESVVVPTPAAASRSEETSSSRGPVKAGARVIRAGFDEKKDYLVVSVEIAADSKSPIRPEWGKARLVSGKKEIAPYKLWAERKEVQKDSRVKARFIFAKPDVERDLKDSSFRIPRLDGAEPFTLALGGAR